MGTYKGPEKKKLRKSAAITFKRAPFSQELFSKENKRKFNHLPPWQRQLVGRIIEHSDLAKAAIEANVSRHVNNAIDIQRANSIGVRECLSEVGVDARYIAQKLRECLDAEVVKIDKKGNVIPIKALDLTLKTCDMLLRLRGDFAEGNKKDTVKEAEELFSETQIEDSEN